MNAFDKAWNFGKFFIGWVVLDDFTLGINFVVLRDEGLMACLTFGLGHGYLGIGYLE